MTPSRRVNMASHIERRKFLATLGGAVAWPLAAQAQSYPSRPITIVVPFPAGGPTDALARVLADRMKGALGQSVIVENPTGAAGTIGTGRVARAAPDGYTVILGHWQTHVVNGATYALPFDVVNDPGFGGGADRPDIHPSGERAGPSSRWSAQGLCGHGQDPVG